MCIAFRVLPLSFLIWIAGQSAVFAGTVRIEPTTSNRSVALVAEDATLVEVVAKLSETYGFRLEQKGGARSVEPSRDGARGDDARSVDGRYEGSLRVVLDRLLAKESYFIEHAAESKSGIARVVLYSGGGTAVIAKVAGPSPTTINRPEPAFRPAMMPPVQAIPPQIPAIVPPIRRVQPPTAPVRSGTAASPLRQQALPSPTAPAPRKRGGLVQ
jgi:hypothetical protein